jgi:hypothetical protein
MLNHALFKCPMPVAPMGRIFVDQLADRQKDFSSVYKVFVLLFISSEGIAFPFYCIYLHTLYYNACKWLKYNWALT